MRGLLAVAVAGAARALHTLGEPLGAHRALREAIESDQHASPAEGHQANPLRLARSPADGIARRNVEVHAPRLAAIEDEAPVHLEEREVRADEDRVIRGIEHVHLGGAAPGVEGDRPLAEQDLSGRHRAPPGAWAAARAPIGRSTWSTRIPSPKRHSIFTVPISSATPSRTSSAATALCPIRMTSS